VHARRHPWPEAQRQSGTHPTGTRLIFRLSIGAATQSLLSSDTPFLYDEALPLRMR